MYTVKDPEIIDNVFSKVVFLSLQQYAKNIKESSNSYDFSFGRHQIANTEELYYFHNSILDIAKKYFDNEKIIPTWNMLAIYEKEQAKLWKHKDDNACTFHLDVCVYQNDPWDLWIEGKPYRIFENQAIAMYGNDQEHWRENFPNPETNVVCNAFFFFAEPDHWFFSKGPEYLSVIRGEQTEEEFLRSRECL